jgi:tRNA G18 (ribose-2'-O)-methylase SpoU
VPVAALVDAQRPPAVVQRLPDDLPVYAGGEQLRAVVTKLGVPSTVIALFERPARTSVERLAASSQRLVVVEAVDNPANIGAIVRNAAGLGWEGMITDRTSADPLARRSMRVSMGHAVDFPHARAADIGAAIRLLRERGFTVAALTPDPDATDLRTLALRGKVALCVGAERVGLSQASLSAATLRVRIPMQRGVDSLNVAAATAIGCYALRADDRRAD